MSENSFNSHQGQLRVHSCEWKTPLSRTLVRPKVGSTVTGLKSLECLENIRNSHSRCTPKLAALQDSSHHQKLPQQVRPQVGSTETPRSGAPRSWQHWRVPKSSAHSRALVRPKVGSTGACHKVGSTGVCPKLAWTVPQNISPEQGIGAPQSWQHWSVPQNISPQQGIGAPQSWQHWSMAKKHQNLPQQALAWCAPKVDCTGGRPKVLA